MPQHEIVRAIVAFQKRHLRVYTMLCQLAIAIVTFYCVIAISHYDPTPASRPSSVALRTPLHGANSTTPHICKTGVRESFEDLDAVLIAMTPYSVLCPSTALFLLAIITFLLGISTFNYLHTEDIDLVDGYSYFVIAGLMALDWQNVLESLRVTLPILIWSATLLLPIGHWLLQTFFPGIYGRYRQAIRLHREAMWRAIDCRGGTVGDVEAGRETEEGDGGDERIGEETPLRIYVGRSQMYGHL
ncbi:hypothetical protein BJ875DRAFT_473634 [Amylocarpus encephaloides]|uniref:Uncharacterized protein n=1 Tax=Amylocarpus encephaloides TaxID=45428 RepID=A0A9P7Y9P6_9HELO|nr:hypothetical protein BJ875DRAFT_473634 [Amylocarpus encephaloides]